ncbi:FAD-dependent monooxygenase [Williamsia herbipolensis]|uniref:FAD-dependent monooxygenase n=1 Tax=Williamsia herbipolensis TaxID=1603258 RepID=A0AAU4JYK5_9NOCA|nr:FAD-dependent monooxygenase [Williamsia herbipolensis]
MLLVDERERLGMGTQTHRTEVAIVGGGPVGMAMAAELALLGVDTVVIEIRTETDERPRAGTVHARSLSHLARRGYIPSRRPDEIARGEGRLVSTPFQFAAQPVLTITAPAVEPAPIAGIPQARLEAAFEHRARGLGATVLRGHTVREITDMGERFRLDLATAAPDGVEAVDARWVIGADGARSVVAEHGDFGTHTYPATMNALAGLARADHPGPPPGWNATSTGWTLHNPNPGGKARIIAMDFSGPLAVRDTPDPQEYLQRLGAVLGAPPELDEISHLTRFSDHGRHRTRMRDGRMMLIGDAAHVHYPLGGQGLNTGMQDAFTLGWRLAAVVDDTADPSVLDEWSRERVHVAEVVVANTVVQSRMMNPGSTDLRDAVVAMLSVPGLHDALADVISGQFQPGFQTDLVITADDGTVTTLAELLTRGTFVGIAPDSATPLPGAIGTAGSRHPEVTVVHGKVTPEQPWVSALIRPDGYLAATH